MVARERQRAVLHGMLRAVCTCAQACYGPACCARHALAPRHAVARHAPPAALISGPKLSRWLQHAAAATHAHLQQGAFHHSKSRAASAMIAASASLLVGCSLHPERHAVQPPLHSHARPLGAVVNDVSQYGPRGAGSL